MLHTMDKALPVLLLVVTFVFREFSAEGGYYGHNVVCCMYVCSSIQLKEQVVIPLAWRWTWSWTW